MPAKSMVHLNGNLLCAIDVETTGFLAGKHDIIQVAVVPLGSDMRPLNSVLPFYMEMQPKRPHNIDKGASATHHINLAALMLRALDADKVCDLFVEWFYALNLGIGKKIIPLAHNWQFDKSFVVEWLTPETYNTIFHFHYRDSMIAASFMNDRADFHVEKVPFPKVSLEYLCNILGVHNEKAHDALQDCYATAECYRKLCIHPTL